MTDMFLDTTIKYILMPMGPLPDNSDLIWDLKDDNYKTFKEICGQLPPNYIIDEDGLLLYKNKLYINWNIPLYTYLIWEAHDQISSAHPSALKTYQLLEPKYYWKGISMDYKTYINNYSTCKWAYSNQIKQ